MHNFLPPLLPGLIVPIKILKLNLFVALRDALDYEIFEEARNQNVVVMSKDDDFTDLVAEHGPPPLIIWVTCGNTSNAKMREILSKTLPKAKELLERGETVVEISDK
jgi:predicted nuclease of predicted toxin-antitoxin system